MLVFLKLGGSLITNKSQAITPRLDVLRRVASEIKEALDARPDLSLLIGHGSGSFGHSVAAQYQTHLGVRTHQEWQGFSQVSVAAAQLNQLVLDTLHGAGIPVFRIQPSASAICRDRHIVEFAISPIRRTLAARLVPLVYGDVAIDEVRGATIISTEALFAHLAPQLQPSRMLLAGDYEGVLDGHQRVMPRVTRSNLAELTTALEGSAFIDVTGGMASKVDEMLELCDTVPGLRVQIFSGNTPGLIRRILLDDEFSPGTCVAPS